MVKNGRQVQRGGGNAMTEQRIDEIELDAVKLGKRVKTARKAVHKTQKAMADLCDCTPTHLSNVEQGKIGISLELLYKISIVTGKSLDYFVMDNPAAKPQTKADELIYPLLVQCDQPMLDMTYDFLKRLVRYHDQMKETLAKELTI